MITVKPKSRNNSNYAVIALLSMITLGCGDKKDATDLVWAVNVGGPAFTGMDGTRYVAEESVTGGTVGTMEIVKGSQDPFLYETFREGDIQIARPIANGTYDITFHFAEPRDYRLARACFDAFAEGER